MKQNISKVCAALAVLCMFNVCAEAYICCAQDQFTAHVFYDSGTVLIEANSYSSYLTSSGYLAYDRVNNRTAYSLTGTVQSPLYPPVPINVTVVIRDGTLYSVSNEGKCEKRPSTYQKLCVPDNAVIKSSGYVGDRQGNVTHYSYTVQGTHSPYQYDTLVASPGSVPLQASFFVPLPNPDSGTLTTVLIGDIESGIKDPSVFDIPAACKNKTLHFKQESDINDHTHPLKHFFL